jgi:hypothetical protein
MKKVILFVFSALLAGLVSCEKEEIAFDSTADVFVIVKLQSAGAEIDTVYGIALHVFANKPMQTVTANLESDPEISYTLNAYDNYPYDFYFETDENEFTPTMPELGNYMFDVIAQTTGETATLSDGLLEDIIYPAENFVCAYDTEEDEMKVTWNEIDDVDYLIVRMYDEDGGMVFSSAAITNGNTVEYTFDAAKAGWLNGKSPVDGEGYLIRLDAYSFEPGKSDLDLQAKAMNFQNVTWGE